MAKSMGEVLLDKGYELQEEYRGILERRAANRRSLRDLGTQGLLSPEEESQVHEMYPERQRAAEEVAAA